MKRDLPTVEPLPPLHPEAVRILPLGGLGEIGLNMMVIEAADGLLIIDCGPVSYTHLTLPTICFKCSWRWWGGR